MRLVRPVSPVLCYAIENLAAMPLRLVISGPIAFIMLLSVDGARLPADLGGWLLFFFSWASAWLLTFIVHVTIGTLSLFMEQSMKLMDAWFAGYLVLSGYLIPVALFPETLVEIAHWLPFHSQVGLPVELLLGTHAPAQALTLVAIQWGWILALGSLLALLWRRGLRRYGAFGG